MRRAVTACLTAVALLVLLSGPAHATDPVKGQGLDPGEPMNPLLALLLFVGVPLAVALLVAAVVWLPGAMTANRYRPNRPWNATPVWFAGPPNPVVAVQQAQVGDMVRGGARGDW